MLADLDELEYEFSLHIRRVNALSTIYQLTTEVANIETQDDVDIVLDHILSAALTLTHAERGFIVLCNPDTVEDFTVRAVRKIAAQDTSNEEGQLSRSLIAQILAGGEGIVTDNVRQDERFLPGDSLLTSNIRSVMATPIKLQKQVIGGIYVDSELVVQSFRDEDLETLNTFADHAAVALNLATSIRERRELYLQSILALVNAVEAADAYTAGHSSRVGYYARCIAKLLGFPPKEAELIMFAGYLHDVGKIALTVSVNKSGPLTDEEWQEMKKHPVYGERILRNLPALADILPAVRSHHERWDGRGYPDELVAEAIHPYARIIGVADSFDAMTSNRSYRDAFTASQALNEIREGIDSQYERRAAEAFLHAFESGTLKLISKADGDEAFYPTLEELSRS